MRYVSRVQSYFQNRRTKKQQENATDRAARSTANATWAIAILTAVTIGVGVSQYIVFGRQLDAMEGDQRPWITGDIAIDGDLFTNSPFRSTDATIALKSSLKNVGRSPAFRVQLFAKMFATRPFGFNFKTTEFGGIGKITLLGGGDPEKYCQSVSISFTGITIFPGDVNIGSQTSAMMEKETVTKAVVEDKKIYPVIAACILYESGTEKKLRHTLKVFHLMKSECLCGFTTEDTSIPAKNLRLQPFMLGFPMFDMAD